MCIMKVDVCVIVVINWELCYFIMEKSFWEDFYFRFVVFFIYLVFLWDRREDILLFVVLFMKCVVEWLNRIIVL